MDHLFDTTRNFSIDAHKIPAAWVLAFLPRAYVASYSEFFENGALHTRITSIEKEPTIDSATKACIIRCKGAHVNGFQNLGLFSAAVLAGNVAGLPHSTLNALSGGYLISQAVYNYTCIKNKSTAMSSIRSIAFLSGIAQIFMLLIKSGNMLRENAADLS